MVPFCATVRKGALCEGLAPSRFNLGGEKLYLCAIERNCLQHFDADYYSIALF